MTKDPILAEFRKAVSGPDEEIDLGRAAFEIARVASPDLDVDEALEGLDALAARTATRIGGSENPIARVEALKSVVLDGLGLTGAGDDYYDPRNSYLDQVLERRRGIPISLSVLLMSVGARAGVSLGGASLPFHFLVRVLGVQPPIFVDPFDGGRFLTLEECEERVHRMGRGRIRFEPGMADIASNGEILTRMLNNLKSIHLNALEYAKVLPILDRLLVLNPEAGPLFRERGLVLYRLGERGAARRDLRDYLAATADPPDAKEILGLLRRIDE